MKQNEKLSHNYLLEILEYFPDTGIFVWKVNRGKHGNSGKEAGCKSSSTGRHSIRINKILYLRSRLAWFYVHGIWPENEIDHRNRNRNDDRIENLREATHQENMWNRTRIRKNKKLPKCITICGNRFRVALKHENKLTHLGTFTNLEEAIECRNSFEKIHRKFLYDKI